MKKAHVIGYTATALVALAIGGGASSGGTATPVAAPAVTQTVMAPAPPAVTITQTLAAPAPKPVDKKSLGQVAMQTTWDGMSKAERKSICDGWNTPSMQDYLFEVFMDSSGGQFDRDEARAFFDAHC